MARIHRLVLCLFFTAFCPLAFAAFPATSGPPPITDFDTSGCNAWNGGAAASCSVVFFTGPASSSATGYTDVPVGSIGVKVVMGGSYPGSTWQWFIVSPVLSCPSNSLLVNGSCTCNNGFSEQGAICINSSQAATCTAAKGGSDWYSGFTTLPKFGNSFCPSDGAASGCGTTIDGGYCAIKNGVRSCSYEVKYTGASCTPPVSSTESPKQDPCKGSSGTVNGVTVCVPVGTDPTVTTETGKTTTETTTKPGADGGAPVSTTTTTDQTTSCTGNQCSTTTTTTTSGGGSGGTGGTGGTTGETSTTTTTKDAPKFDFCSENPQALQCKTGSFGGSCSAAFNCDGDAVMCAIALDQHKRNCTLFETPTAESALYDSEKDKEGSQATNEAKSIGAGSFDTSDAIGGGSGCIADKAVTVMGKTFMVPFSSVCPSLALFGNVMLVVSFLLAGRIVVRG